MSRYMPHLPQQTWVIMSDIADGSSPERDDAGERVAARAAEVVAGLCRTQLSPGLYLVATPIGSLSDITLRALSVLARADIVYAEDTRHSGVLLSHYGIRAKMRAYHEHNASAERPRVLAALEDGKCVALISDAGTPLVSDPGYKLVRDVVDEGHAVVSVPGPSAVLAALTSSGLPTDSFLFAGFLPAKSGSRQNRISELVSVPATLVFFEAPSRVAGALADLAKVLGAGRTGVVARELTKMHEEVRRGTLEELAHDYADAPVKGECVIVVGPPAAGAGEDVSDDIIRKKLEAALGSLRLRDAAQVVAGELNIARRRVYELGLKVKGERE